MRIAIATVKVPFISGGAEVHAEELRTALLERGYEAEILAIPFKWYPPERILDHMLACRLLDLTESEGQRIDCLIGLKFPAYLISHPNKVLWILHQHRQAYDLWNDPAGGDLITQENGARIRDAIVQADKHAISESRRVFANSHNVAQRLEKFCGMEARALYHPPRGAGQFSCETSEQFLFFPSRLLATKRQILVLEALRKTSSPVRVLFSGAPNRSEYLSELKQFASRIGVSQRVDWLGSVSEQEKRKLYARCLAVIYPPLDEDLGYVTLEAMLSSKPVITCTDSGGPLEFVEAGITGEIAEPTPEALAQAMDRLWSDRQCAALEGKAGREKYEALGISWDHVIESLLGRAAKDQAR